jgi:trimethylamine:corrinoid methyltransferase-like protein
MDEILELERDMRKQLYEHQMQTARYEATAKAINDMMQMATMFNAIQMHGLMLAGMFNPNFCKPK